MTSFSLIFFLNKDAISRNLFSSNKYEKFYLSSYLSPSIVLSQLDIAAPEYFNIVEAIQNVIVYINRNGGFTAIGWYKHGTINDRTLVEKNNNTIFNNNNNADNQANASEINYCIIQLIPTNQKIQESHQLEMGLEQLKYDVSLLLNAN